MPISDIYGTHEANPLIDGIKLIYGTQEANPLIYRWDKAPIDGIKLQWENMHNYSLELYNMYLTLTKILE